MPFASRTRVGPGKHLLHIADRFEANTVLCSFNTIQPSIKSIRTASALFLERVVNVWNQLSVSTVGRMAYYAFALWHFVGPLIAHFIPCYPVIWRINLMIIMNWHSYRHESACLPFLELEHGIEETKTDVTPAIYRAILSPKFIARQNRKCDIAHRATSQQSRNPFSD